MADTTYLAGDFSGIQRFVLRVKTAGKAQAKRLRARSFFLELLEHAALSVIRTRFDVPDDDVLVRGGGGFLVRVSVVEVKFELVMRITSKGQVTIPQRLRNKCGLLPNTEVNFEEGDGGVVIRPMVSKRAPVAERLRRARGVAGGDLGTDDVMRLTRGDE